MNLAKIAFWASNGTKTCTLGRTGVYALLTAVRWGLSLTLHRKFRRAPLARFFVPERTGLG